MRISLCVFNFLKNIHVRSRLALCAVWIGGLILGTYLLQFSSIVSLMRMVFFDRSSIVILLLTCCLPFLISFILHKLLGFYAILPFVFLKACAFICTVGGITLAYNDGGWLVSFLLLFSDWVLIVPLLWFWSRGAATLCADRRALTICLIVAVIVGCFDYFIVSPFVRMIFEF